MIEKEYSIYCVTEVTHMKNQTIPITKSVRVPDIIALKNIRNITALTAYDYLLATLLDQSGVDLILVGDSLASVVQGHETTLPVTLDEMIYHCKCVTRGVKRALVIGDLPFLSYQPSIETAIISAGRLLKEGNVSAVKLEGGENVAKIISALTSYDIPVMGHIGLTPQSFHRMGGHKIQGKSLATNSNQKAGTREQILKDAKAVEESGAFSVVLEGIPEDLAKEITKILTIPTIGIGAGSFCDGQILVTTDMLGLNTGKTPSFVTKYANLAGDIKRAVIEYCDDTIKGERKCENF